MDQQETQNQAREKVDEFRLHAELAALRGRYEDATRELQAARQTLGDTTEDQFLLQFLHTEVSIAHGQGCNTSRQGLVFQCFRST